MIDDDVIDDEDDDDDDDADVLLPIMMMRCCCPCRVSFRVFQGFESLYIKRKAPFRSQI